MQELLKKHLLNNASIKVLSLIFGFLLWVTLSQSYQTTVWLTVPVCFYNNEQKNITAPETIQIELQGKRTDLMLLDLSRLAVHLDAQQLTQPIQTVAISAHNLFLPDSIKLVHYTPSNITINLHSHCA